jgi:hypothetical protein
MVDFFAFTPWHECKGYHWFCLQLLSSGFELNNSHGLCHRVVMQGCSVFQGYLLKIKGCSNICNGKHVTEWLGMDSEGCTVDRVTFWGGFPWCACSDTQQLKRNVFRDHLHHEFQESQTLHNSNIVSIDGP